MPGARRLAICVSTYRRPNGLRRLLQGIENLRFDLAAAPETRVVVADNDPSGSAQEVCREFAGTRLLLDYRIEPARGIPQARNATLDMARTAGADLMAFIDDDEEPTPGWLDNMIAAMDAFDADVVHGHVEPRLPANAPAWIVEENYFRPPRYATGDRRAAGYTNNLLVKRGVFDALGGFEPSWALCGGTDTLLFSKAFQAGFRIVACREAVVYEDIEPRRMNASWLLKRAFRIGMTSGRVKLTLRRGLRSRGETVARGFFLAAGAGARLAAARDRRKRFAAARAGAVAIGILSAAFGLNYQEYR